jgi:outer membrane protein assembly factor BamB
LGSPAFKPTAERPVGWRGDGTGRFTAAAGPLTWERKRGAAGYEAKGIVWMTRMHTGSIASPVIVGDRIFVCSNFADLLCVDKATGRILWLRPNGYYEAATEAERADAGFKAQAAPLGDEVAKLNERFVQQSNALISPAGPTVAQEDALAEMSKQKRDKEAKLYDAMGAVDAQRYAGKPCQQHCGSSSGTPCSDGKRVWASFLGGVAGPASMTVVCYDLDGKRQWLQLIEGIKAPEHGNHSSMLLVGKVLIFMGNDLTIGYDKDSGKELWRVKGSGYTDGIAVPLSFKIGGQDAIFHAFSQANILGVSDGKVICDYQNIGWLWSTPLIDNGIAYYGDRSRDVLLCAVKLPDKPGQKPKELYKVAAPAGSKNTEVVASPLVHDGLAYSISEGGTLAVVDTQTGKEAYFAQPFSATVKWVFNPGVCASPTLAGGRIYLMGDTGTTIVLQPGRAYKALATNVLEEKALDGFGFLSSPWFEGKCLYYRSGNYLYCIGEK